MGNSFISQSQNKLYVYVRYNAENFVFSKLSLDAINSVVLVGNGWIIGNILSLNLSDLSCQE